MKLAYKGLFVVLLPVAFELAFVLRVNDLLQQTDQQIAKEAHAAEFLLANECLDADMICANSAAMSYRCYKLPKFKKDHEEAINTLAADLSRMRKLCTTANEVALVNRIYFHQRAALKLRRMMMDSEGEARMSSMFGGAAYSRLLAQASYSSDPSQVAIEEHNKKREAEAKAQSLVIRKTLHELLLTGALVSLFASIVTAVLFHRQIYSRLQRIVANIDSMIRRVPLIPPERATDEIGELDQAIYKTANSIRNLEQFRAKSAKLMAHELEQPLTHVARSLEEFKEEGFTDKTADGEERIDSARSLVARLQLLIGDLTSIDQVSEARLRLQYSPSSFKAIAQQAIESTSAIARTANITINANLEDIQVECDSDRVTQVVINLLSNAIKFSPPDSTVTVECFKEAEFACISVLDQGKGIDPSFQSKIFHRFEQSEVSDQQKGSGLGLSICRELIEAHGGIMDFESEPGRTKFKIKMPLRQIASEIPAASQTAHSAPKRKQGLWRRGLALVVAPALVQIGVVAVLFFLADRAEQQMETFRHARQIAYLCSDTTDDLVWVISLSVLYNSTGEPTLLGQINERISNMKEELQTLQTVSAPNPKDKSRADELNQWATESLKSVQKVATSPQQDMPLSAWVKDDPTFKPLAEQAANIGHELEEWTKQAQHQAEEQVAMNAQARRDIMNVLLGGLALSVIATLVVALSFARGVCARIQKIIVNSRRLVNQEPLVAPDGKGTDEIATIDEEFYAAAQHLKELDRFKEELMSVTSHELRTPLTALLGNFDVIGTGMYGELTAKGEKLLESASKAAGDLVALITDFLDLEKMRAGKVLVAPRAMSIDSLLNILSDRIQDVRTTSNLPAVATVSGDADRIVQAIASILKTSDQQKLVEATAKDGAIQLSVSSEEPAEADDATFSRRQMSLSLCELIAQQHGGKFSADGEHIVITLPEKAQHE